MREAIQAWKSGNVEPLVSLLVGQVKAVAFTPISDVALVATLLAVLSASSDASTTCEVLRAAVDRLEGEEASVDIFGEALVDVVEGIEQEREDRVDLQNSPEELTVLTEKAVEIVRQLLVSNSVSVY